MKKFANGFARLVFGLCVVMTAPAWALGDTAVQKDAVPKAEAAKEATPAADKKADPKCEGITLTGEKFLDLFHTIAMHGDLTDVPFIEKTLETKFEVKTSGGRAHYTSKVLFGAPMHTELVFDVERNPSDKVYFIARMDFDANIYQCFGIAAQQFKDKFGGPFFPSSTSHGGSLASFSRTIENVGKDGTKITVTYMYNSKNQTSYVYSFNISQDK